MKGAALKLTSLLTLAHPCLPLSLFHHFPFATFLLTCAFSRYVYHALPTFNTDAMADRDHHRHSSNRRERTARPSSSGQAPSATGWSRKVIKGGHGPLIVESSFGKNKRPDINQNSSSSSPHRRDSAAHMSHKDSVSSGRTATSTEQHPSRPPSPLPEDWGVIEHNDVLGHYSFMLGPQGALANPGESAPSRHHKNKKHSQATPAAPRDSAPPQPAHQPVYPLPYNPTPPPQKRTAPPQQQKTAPSNMYAASTVGIPTPAQMWGGGTSAQARTSTSSKCDSITTPAQLWKQAEMNAKANGHQVGSRSGDRMLDSRDMVDSTKAQKHHRKGR